jgi:hypothetical protein
MRKRDRLLALISAHVADGREKCAMRVYVENRCIGFQAYGEARERGLRAVKDSLTTDRGELVRDLYRLPHLFNDRCEDDPHRS